MSTAEQNHAPAADGIAIVGMAVRFPGADSVEAFWRNLRAGAETITFFRDDELRAAGIAPSLLADPSYVKANGVLRGAEEFDAAFFGFSPREAELTDPQHRVFLEVAWEALERAGYDPSGAPGRVGVFAGAGLSTYLLKNLLPNRAVVESAGELALLLGNNKDFVPTRTSYKLDLRGPSVAVNTACSTSLVAVHLAAQSLLDFHCDMALAGGVSVQVPQEQGHFHQAGGIGSPDGHCRAFDAAARGTVSGNGAGVVVLKRLADALADGDTIHAVIRGSAVNNDGANKVGFTAPSVDGQAQVIAEAQAVAGVTPEEISYIEAHGTGTELGDPIEVAALTQAFGARTIRRGTCALGSVKTNFGHLDEAAGIAGLVKTVLALEHRELPASLHFTQPNPKIDFANSPFFVNAWLTPWNSPAGVRRCAGVSSFGIGGTNAHVVLEEAPPLPSGDDGSGWQLLVLSARTPTALARAAENLARELAAQPGRNFADIAYTLAVGRHAFDQRRFVVARDGPATAQLLRAGNSFAEGAPQALIDAGRAWAAGDAIDWPAHFAGQTRRRVVLPTHPFERKRFWIAPPNAIDAAGAMKAGEFRLNDELTGLAVSEAALARNPELIEVSTYREFARELEGWCGAVLSRYVGGGPDQSGPGRRERWVDRRDRLGVQRAFWKAFDCFLRALAADGFVRVEGEEIVWLKPPAEAAAIAAERTRLETRYPEFRGIVRLVEHCTSRYPDALSGRVPAITVLYPDGRSDLLETMGREMARHTNKAVYLALLKEAIVRRLSAAPGRTLRILEVGVGDGLLAGEIAPALAGRNVKYVATDLSRAFVTKAEKAAAAAGFDFMEFGVLDITRDPAAQGFARGSFDWVIGLDVVHATPRLADTLGHLRGLLAPGGMLGVIEKVRGERWVDLVWGLAEGWWYFEDRDLRTHSPLMPAHNWERVLRELAFEEVAVLPRDEAARATTDYALLLAQAPMAAANPLDITHWFYTPAWQRSPLPAADVTGGHRRRWLVLDSDTTVGARLAETLVSAGHEVRRGRVADAEFSAEVPDEIVLFASGADWFALVQLARALSATSMSARLTLVSDGAQAVEAGDALRPEQALLMGPLRVIPRELPHVTCRNIDLSLAEEGALEQLMDELSGAQRDTVVAWRGRARFVQTFAASPLPSAPARPACLRDRGVYLITGGLGSMGLAFARELARAVRARLVLVGRSTPTAEQQAKLHELLALGAEVWCVQADVTDREAMGAVVREARARFGAVHGAIHAAGVYGQGLMWDRPRAAMEAVLAPKVAGARVLADVLQGEPLDFLVLCSSLAAVDPTAGQVDYCAANAFLDAFAADFARRTGTRSISLGWGMWQELGMMEHPGLPAAQKQAVRDEIAREGWGGAGVEALWRVLAHATSAHVLVSPHPLRAGGRPLPPLFSEKREEAGGRVDYVVRLRPSRQWVLDEHRLEGRATLPGTAYLELACAALADHAAAKTVELSDVYFLSPLVFEGDEEKEVRVVLQGGTFHVIGRLDHDRWIEHARGEIRPVNGAATTEPAKPAPALVAAAWPADAVRFGPRWRNVREVAFAENAGAARLELAAEFHRDVEQHPLHPALFDLATGFITVRHSLPDSLPFSYRRVRVHRPLPTRFRSEVRVVSRTEHTLDLDAVLTAEDGSLLVEVEGYQLRRAATPSPAASGENARLTLGAPGLIDSLALVRSARRAPGPAEVEIQVEAAGLNFIEVLYSLGMLPAIPGTGDWLGLECAGTVVRAGVESGFAPGEKVIAYANGCFASYATVPSVAVARRPNGMTAAEAATLPAAFATAHYALLDLGRLRAGESVLIHAASGGVGLAAVQIAQQAGAEIYATAGSAEKRDLLHALGVKHVMDSRTLAFAEEVTRLTGGRGVDVVLNSLGGEFLKRSLALVAPHGRFLELGKRDLFAGAQLDLRAFTRIISFIVVDVGPDLPRFAELWQEVARRIDDGEYRPLPHTTFSITAAREAFDFMARARHRGKVVLTLDEPAALLAVAGAARSAPVGRTLAEILGEASPEPSRRVVNGQVAASVRDENKRSAPAVASTAAVGEEENAIVRIWQELLGVEQIGAQDNFFDLNGDSLLAAQVVARLHTAFQVKLPLSVLFDAPTVAALAGRVRAARQGARRGGPDTAAVGEEEGKI